MSDDIRLLNEAVQAAIAPEEKRLLDNLSIAPDCVKGQPCVQCANPMNKGMHTCDEFGPVNLNGAEPDVLPKRDKGGRPKGYDGRKSKMPSAMAQAFKRAGLDWQVDFAVAIKRASNYDLSKAERSEARERIALWLRLLPYLITSSARSKGKKWKGGPSKAALIALKQLEAE